MEQNPESNPPISIWPIILAGGLTLMIIGVVTSLIVSIVGVIVVLAGIAGWAQESRIFSMQEEEEPGEEKHE
ncbi:MAG TPA: cytochrome c oxidase subunit 4 [Anaerolineaceae bacterium]|nr:cytochrome c oxidase subunit 4 [Anaerolineaceae bacterium]